MEANNTDSSDDHSKKANPGYDYPSQPDSAPYYYDDPGYPQYYPPNPPSAPYYQGGQSSIHGNTVVVTQPTPNVTHAVGVQDNMGLAIFACLCCFWPLGIYAIVKACESRKAATRGELHNAQVSARESRKVSLFCIGIGVFVSIVITIVQIILATTTGSFYSYPYSYG